MATAQQMIDAIVERVNNSKSPEFTTWRIGLTNDVKQRYIDWDRPEFFLYWEADSLEDAQAVESHFIKKLEMKGGTGGDLDTRKTVYVYIF